jgi:UDP-glucose 4-epimerase
LAEHPGFHYRIGSVTSEELVGAMVDRVDCVFHLAAAVGVKLIVTNPTRTIETNIRGSEVVLGAAAKKGKLTVIASTSEVYGKGTKIPFGEDDDLVLGPTTKSRWGYACSKAIDEYLALAYAKESQLPVLVVRLFNTVGPRQTGRYGMVLPTFVRQGLGGHDITVYGSGAQQRCFADVGDVVEALVRLVDVPEAYGKVFNIGSDEEISINDLAHLVQRKTGGVSRIVHVPYDEAYDLGFEDLQRRVPDVGKLEAAIGFRPRTTIETIVERVVDSVREREPESAAPKAVSLRRS